MFSLTTSIAEVATSVAQNPKQPILMAIEGFGGSGKTTLANQLMALLANGCLIHMDDFIRKDKLLVASPDQLGFDRLRLEQQVLLPLSTGQPAGYQRLDWVNNILSEPISIPLSKYVLVEGISAYHPAIAHYYDYKIWIDTPIDIAKQRGKHRDAGNENEQHWDLWAANDVAYQRKYRPEQRANFVIRNYDRI